jgi:hypothetical protein
MQCIIATMTKEKNNSYSCVHVIVDKELLVF